MPRILLIEDDRRVSSFVRRGLEAEGHAVDVAETGQDGLAMARAATYPLILLDRMLPDTDGLEVCQTLRHERRDSAILMLTAKDAIQERVAGLRGGADDYLTKPFAFDELVARVEALLRRAAKPVAEGTLQVADLVIDRARKAVSRAGRDITLTAKEYALLEYLMTHAGTVVSRPRLLNNVWDLNHDPGTKVVDVYIRYLRKKIDIEGMVPLIRTMRGFGYILTDAPHRFDTADDEDRD